MCCGQTSHHHKDMHSGSCCCARNAAHCGTAFWSKNKKLNMLEHALQGAQTEVKELEEAIAELRQEK